MFTVNFLISSSKVQFGGASDFVYRSRYPFSLKVLDFPKMISSILFLILVTFFNLVAAGFFEDYDQAGKAIFATIAICVLIGICGFCVIICACYQRCCGPGHRGKQRVRIGRTFAGQTFGQLTVSLTVSTWQCLALTRANWIQSSPSTIRRIQLFWFYLVTANADLFFS